MTYIRFEGSMLHTGDERERIRKASGNYIVIPRVGEHVSLNGLELTVTAVLYSFESAGPTTPGRVVVVVVRVR